MSKYEKFGQYLEEQLRHGNETFEMTFEEIERVLGFELPASQRYPAWWSNNPKNNPMTAVWLKRKFYTKDVDVMGKKVSYYHMDIADVEGASDIAKTIAYGLAEEAREFKHAEPKSGRHPLIGAMKGTFTIEPGFDLTSPMFDPDELAEWEANLDRTADMIEEGMSRKRR